MMMFNNISTFRLLCHQLQFSQTTFAAVSTQAISHAHARHYVIHMHYAESTGHRRTETAFLEKSKMKIYRVKSAAVNLKFTEVVCVCVRVCAWVCVRVGMCVCPCVCYEWR